MSISPITAEDVIRSVPNSKRNNKRDYIKQLAARGYKLADPKAEAQVVIHNGRPYYQVEMVTEEEKFGKLISVPAQALATVAMLPVGAAKAMGLTDSKALEKQYAKLKDTVKSDDPLLLGGRAGNAALAVLTPIAAPIEYVFGDGENRFMNDVTIPALSGQNVKTVYIDAGEEAETDGRQLKAKIGYDPTDRDDMVLFMKDKVRDGEARVLDDGSYVYVETHREGISSYIIVPQGDYTKTTSKRCYYTKTGDSVKDEATLWRHINATAITDKTITTGWEKIAKEIGMKIAKEKGINDKDEIQKIIEQVKKQPIQVVVSVKNNHARIYLNNLDPNDKTTNSVRTGYSISFTDEDTKQLDALYSRGAKFEKEIKGRHTRSP